MSLVDRKKMKEDYKIRPVVGAIVAIRNKKNGKIFIQATQDLAGSRNRYDFACKTGAGLPLKVQKEWQKESPENFEFLVLEELKKGEAQTDKEFADDMSTLKEMWLEKISPDELY